MKNIMPVATVLQKTLVTVCKGALSPCKRLSFGVWKAAFCTPKGYLL